MRTKCFLVVNVVVWNKKKFVYFLFCQRAMQNAICHMDPRIRLRIQRTTATALNYSLPVLLLLLFIRMLRIERVPVVVVGK